MTTKPAATCSGHERRIGAIPSLRWWIAGILFASTVINYIDRQTLSLLAPFLKQEYHWSNIDYANIVIAFRISYSIGQTLCGRLMDQLGTRRGLQATVLWYSIVSICTPLARGLYSFAGFRFLLGAGESANWPGATKAVAEWFPKRERALATAFFDSGSSVGGAIAPFIVLGIFFRWGWRPAVAIPGLLGFGWLFLWRSVYHTPEDHPRISTDEREMILAERRRVQPAAGTRLRWRDLLKLPQTWGTIAAKALSDPVWFFITDWFPIYLLTKGISLRNNLVAVWVPFVTADLGSLFGGWLSGRLVRRGWPLGAARKAVVVFGGIGTTLLIPTILTDRVVLITALFALASFCYGSFTTIANVLPSDLYATESVASVSGLSGTGAGIGTIIAFELVGRFSDVHARAARHSFDPIMIAAGLVPLAGMILVLLLVRNTRATDQGLVHRI
jgi:MFS transporter, ACS family, hexuronate transporter